MSAQHRPQPWSTGAACLLGVSSAWLSMASLLASENQGQLPVAGRSTALERQAETPHASPAVLTVTEAPAAPDSLPVPAPDSKNSSGVGQAQPGREAQLPSEAELRADQQIYDHQLGRLIATGNVSAMLAGGRLLADRLEYATASRTLYASGRIRFQRGNQYLQASRLRFSLSEGSGDIEDVYGVLDLETSATDFAFASSPSTPLPPPAAMACPPSPAPQPQGRIPTGSGYDARQPPQIPPAPGCPGAPSAPAEAPPPLSERLETVAFEGERTTSEPQRHNGRGGRQPTPPEPGPGGSPKDQAAPPIAQRISALQFRQSLTAEQRFGFPADFTTPDAANTYGQIRPPQLADLTTRSNQELVRGTVNRWRFQARRMRITPSALMGDRVAFTNDPFTPAQSWLDSENVVARFTPKGDIVITADRTRLVLDNKLRIPLPRRTTIRKQEEVANRLILGVDESDRDGVYSGYSFPIRIGGGAELNLQPQFMIQRALENSTDSYPLPGSAPGAEPQSQPVKTGDLFGLLAQLEGQLGTFNINANLDLSTFNPENLANGTRAWGDVSRNIHLPLVGESTLRLFGAYRYRVWNGSLGEQDVYSAYGISLEDSGELAGWGQIKSDYYWRLGIGNYQANAFDSTELSDLFRANAIGSLNLSLPLWTSKTATDLSPDSYTYSAVPIAPGLQLNTNLLGTLAYYGDGLNQNTLTFSAGPTLTLGHFKKPFLDFTRLTITGSATLRQGASPLSFDRAVDLGAIGIGLSQQILGPLVFDGGVAVNIDPGSPFYGDITNSYLELRWQRRSFDIGLFYSPYSGLGGIRVRLNDFGYKGSGLPFVPLQPQAGRAGAGDRLF